MDLKTYCRSYLLYNNMHFSFALMSFSRFPILQFSGSHWTFIWILMWLFVTMIKISNRSPIDNQFDLFSFLFYVFVEKFILKDWCLHRSKSFNCIMLCTTFSYYFSNPSVYKGNDQWPKIYAQHYKPCSEKCKSNFFSFV